MSASPTKTPLDAGARPAVRAPASRPPGNTDGNERLTVQAGAVLFVLLGLLGITIVRIGQLTWLHLFLGLLLIGPLTLKLLSTGYRFARYYTGAPPYRQKGPPPAALRVMAPLLVLDTLAIFVSGVVLLLVGPSSRDMLMSIHKVSFIIWLVLASLHVLGHLPELARGLVAPRQTRLEVLAAAGIDPAGRRHEPRAPGLGDWTLAPRLPGSAGRAIALGVSLLGGLVLALLLIPDFHIWVQNAAHR